MKSILLIILLTSTICFAQFDGWDTWNKYDSWNVQDESADTTITLSIISSTNVGYDSVSAIASNDLQAKTDSTYWLINQADAVVTWANADVILSYNGWQSAATFAHTLTSYGYVYVGVACRDTLGDTTAISYRRHYYNYNYYHEGDHYISYFKSNDDSIVYRKRLAYTQSSFEVYYEAKNSSGTWITLDSLSGVSRNHIVTTQTVNKDTVNVSRNFAINDTVLFREILADRTDHYTTLFQFDSNGIAVNKDSLVLPDLTGSIGVLTDANDDTSDTYYYMTAEGDQVYREKLANTGYDDYTQATIYYEFKNNSATWVVTDSLKGCEMPLYEVDTDSLIYAFTRFSMANLGLSGFKAKGGIESTTEDSVEDVANNIYMPLGGTSSFAPPGDSVYSDAQATANEAFHFKYIPGQQSNRGPSLWVNAVQGLWDGTHTYVIVFNTDSADAGYYFGDSSPIGYLKLNSLSDKRLNFGYRTPAYSYRNMYSTTTVNKNIWYHIVVTCDFSLPNNDRKIYVNGNLETTYTSSPADVAIDHSTPLNIGAQTTAGGGHVYSTNVRYILIYSTVKDATWVLNHYNNAIEAGWIPGD